MEYDSDIKKQWHSAICRNVGELGEHYATWNKSDWERQILYGLCEM